ncbi:uncharacterized protein RCC_01484 [Ramularia collo-cygni]|uniref:Uncharacterized protein n=1 Tax=Ramularia collo-cygni TaxID=112498 RepID=A0A2D3UX06_9PEZI|nr:uncharacterized protein RCC_01484 [Ramularia collo-cygni]CZT15646.1 uncharacterized protein RCC_01484 [Ramularia collo-cygni]
MHQHLLHHSRMCSSRILRSGLLYEITCGDSHEQSSLGSSSRCSSSSLLLVINIDCCVDTGITRPIIISIIVIKLVKLVKLIKHFTNPPTNHNNHDIIIFP